MSSSLDEIFNREYKVIQPHLDMHDLDIICTKCSIYDKKSKLVKKQLMRYNDRDELFRCDKCKRSVSEQHVKSILNLNQEQYIEYKDETPIKETLQKRRAEENYVIIPNNPLPLWKNRNDKAVVITRNEY